MEGKVKVRFPNELWWDEVDYSKLLDFYDIQVTYLSDETCFVDLIGEDNTKIHVELYRPDYDRLVSDKVIKINFKVKKHTFST